jgi:hypothetical protein
MIKAKIFKIPESSEQEINDFLAIHGDHITDNGISTFVDKIMFYYHEGYVAGDKAVQLVTIDNRIDAWTQQLIDDEVELRFYKNEDVMQTEEEIEINKNKVDYFTGKVRQTRDKLHYMKRVKESILKNELIVDEVK